MKSKPLQQFTVECVGPGGVGKTTLVNRFCQGTTTGPWQQVAAFSAAVPALGDLPVFEEWEKRLLELRLYRLTRERMSALDFYAIADLAYRHTILNASIRRGQTPLQLLADEHLMIMMSIELRNWLANDDSHVAFYLANRAFVFFEDRPEAIAARVVRRRDAGIAKPHVSNLKNEDLRKNAEDMLAFYDVMRSLLVKHKAPVLTLDMASDSSVVDEKLKNFLQSLQPQSASAHNQ